MWLVVLHVCINTEKKINKEDLLLLMYLTLIEKKLIIINIFNSTAINVYIID